ncbi:slc35e3 [Scenedesmus sp. PABB004]|nr:slc35e3 [Scenedesmus sp. PABB004]
MLLELRASEALAHHAKLRRHGSGARDSSSGGAPGAAAGMAAAHHPPSGEGGDGEDAALLGGAGGKARAAAAPVLSSAGVRQLLPAIVYGLANLSSVVAIVCANKVVMSTYRFSFPVALTLCHSVVTALGMAAMTRGGLFTPKRLPLRRTLPVAAAYVGFVVFNNLSIQVNPVGFYQISKIAITPVVVGVEYVAYRKTVSGPKLAAIALLLLGIAVATVSDAQVSANPLGVLVAGAAVLASALYQVWAGRKQAELGVNGNQLLHQVAPVAVALLAALVPAVEPLGLRGGGPGTVLGYELSRGAAAWILLSSCLGLVVTLSTYLFIGATSPLTYNVVGHLKTVFIVASGVVFFGDAIAPKKLAGLVCAMAGIVWYTAAPQQPAAAAAATAAQQQQQQPAGGDGGGGKQLAPA